MVFSTDHPNGGSFMSYPRLIRLLMDREFRKRGDGEGQPEGAAADGAGRRPGPRVHAQRDRHHHPRRPGAAARAGRQGPPRARRRRRHHALRGARRQGAACSAPRATSSRTGRSSSRTTSSAPTTEGRVAARGAGLRSRRSTEVIRPVLRGVLHHPASTTTRWTTRLPRTARGGPDGASARRTATPAANGSVHDEHPRHRGRRHLRRSVRDVGRAGGHHGGARPSGRCRGRAVDDRLRHLGDRLQVRGRHRAQLSAATRRPTGGPA